MDVNLHLSNVVLREAVILRHVKEQLPVQLGVTGVHLGAALDRVSAS